MRMGVKITQLIESPRSQRWCTKINNNKYIRAHVLLYGDRRKGIEIKERNWLSMQKVKGKKKIFFFLPPAFLHRRRGRILRFPSQLTQRRYIKKQLFNFNGHYFDIHLAIKPKIYFQIKTDIILLLRIRTEPLFLRFFCSFFPFFF